MSASLSDAGWNLKTNVSKLLIGWLGAGGDVGGEGSAGGAGGGAGGEGGDGSVAWKSATRSTNASRSTLRVARSVGVAASSTPKEQNVSGTSMMTSFVALCDLVGPHCVASPCASQ